MINSSNLSSPFQNHKEVTGKHRGFQVFHVIQLQKAFSDIIMYKTIHGDTSFTQRDVHNILNEKKILYLLHRYTLQQLTDRVRLMIKQACRHKNKQ